MVLQVLKIAAANYATQPKKGQLVTVSIESVPEHAYPSAFLTTGNKIILWH